MKREEYRSGAAPTRCVALVVQRYGTEVIGGAELHARMLASRLQSDLGYDVEVFTTTARDYQTWEEHYPAGETVVDGVKVRRFRVAGQRWPLFSVFGRFIRLVRLLVKATGLFPGLVRALESLWFRGQGPWCPDLPAALVGEGHRFHRIIFMTYLYLPTVAGLTAVAGQALGGKTILIPLAHDEPPFWFETTKDLLRAAAVILVNSEPEADLVRRRLGTADNRIQVAGVGLEEGRWHPKSGAERQRTHLLYLGRISAGKGVARMLRWLNAADRGTFAGSVPVVLAGTLEDSVRVPPGPRFNYVGYAQPEAVGTLLGQAMLLVNPSAHESLSLIVLEAMLARVPVVVNLGSQVLAYYTKISETVFGFADEEGFLRAVNSVGETDWSHPAQQAKLERTAAWVREHYSWSRVLGKFREHLG